MGIPPALFSLPGCEIDSVRATTTAVIVEAHTTSPTATCPFCHQPSIRVHGAYCRHPRDLPIGDRPVRLLLRVRRFVCTARTCPRRTFAEQLPTWLPSYAQRTIRLSQALQALGFALGGEAGARTGAALQMPLSPDTILRVVHRTPLPVRPTPRVLGVDDFALRKRHTYGTLLVDLEQRQPVDLLPDRTAATLATWLQSHAGVEVIARDRSTEYARGAADGAPQATQVADRWHLIQNMRDAVERALLAVHPQLRKHLTGTPQAEPSPVRRRLKPISSSEAAHQEQSRAARLARYQHVRQLVAAGVSHREIAQRLGMSRTTVIAFAHAVEFPERARRSPLPSILDPYLPYLQQRLEVGCTNSSQLWREIQARGFQGGRVQVARWVRQQRTEPAPTAPKIYRHTGQGAHRAPTAPALAPAKQLAWLGLRDITTLDAAEQALVERLRHVPSFVHIIDVGQRFIEMVRQRQVDAFDTWFADCAASESAALRAFAETLAKDRVAVRAALTEPWSSGQVEGQITRLKLVKRQMYGRASFELLRRRVLHAA